MQTDPSPLSARDGATGSDEQFDPIRLAEIAAGCGHFEIRLSSWTIVWTPGVADIFGLPMPLSGSMDLDRHLQLYVPEDRVGIHRRFVEFLSATEDGRRSYRNHGRIMRPDGEIRHVAVQGIAQVKNGRLEALYGVLFDVSDLARAEKNVREKDNVLRATFEAIDQGILIVGADQRILVHNRRARELMRLPDHVAQDGSLFADLLAFQDESGEFATLTPEQRADIPLSAAGHGPRSYTRRRPDGTFLDVRTSPLPDGGFVRTYTEATERELRAAALTESERRFRSLAESTNDMVVLADIDTTRRYVSPACRKLLGYEPDELVGKRPIGFVHPDDVAAFTAQVANMDHWPDDNAKITQRYRRKDGCYIWVEVACSLIRDPVTGMPASYVATLRDISDRKAVEDDLRLSEQRLGEALGKASHLAAHDALTGLLNRHSFQSVLQHRLASDVGTCALLGCDLDGFKSVNDSLGHAVGDRLLIEVAGRLQAAIGPEDRIARIGGDEFAIVTSSENSEDLARRLVSIVSRPFTLDGHRIQIGMSVGVAVAQPIESVDRLVRCADAAMYCAKSEGRNGVRLYTAALEASAVERSALTRDLREAVAASQMTVHYQPIIDLASGEVRAFEALLRWEHPIRGFVPPAIFIALAEQTGLIVQLGTWVLREACHAAASWAGVQRVCVNVSAMQFRQGSLEEAVLLALASSRLDPRRLEIEITESILIQDTAPVVACLQRLRSLGIQVALDDFGTGYSSLNHLRQFPFDTVKLDRSCVRDLGSDATKVVVNALVGFARSFGARIVAEGVETLAELSLVQAASCGEAQGFLFCRPLERSKAAEMVALETPERTAAA